MENDVVLSNKMEQFGVFIFPIFLPVFAFALGPFLRRRNISNGRIKPYIKHFSFSAFKRDRNSPIQIASNGTWTQSFVNPTFALPINIGFPIFFMIDQNPIL